MPGVIGGTTNADTATYRSNAATQGIDFGTITGTGIGAFTQAGTGTTTLSGTNTMVFEITDSSIGDKLVVGGNLNQGGRTIVNLPSPTPLANGDYTLVEVTGTLGGSHFH